MACLSTYQILNEGRILSLIITGIHQLVFVSKSVPQQRSISFNNECLLTGNRSKPGVASPTEVIRSTMGNVFDFSNIDQAREVARNLVPAMKLITTGQDV